MPQTLKIYGETEGPYGFPMKDADAKAIEALVRDNQGSEFHRAVVEKATSELSQGERADVSWIQTEIIDHQKDIVLYSGFRDDIYKHNPIVTINHDYSRTPIGKSLWRKKLKEGDRKGVKAKTVYPTRPEEWKEEIWPSDSAWALVKSSLMSGKSIGFLAIKHHSPTDEEIRKNKSLETVHRIIDEWMLLEYCCCWLPINPEATVEAFAKSLVTEKDFANLAIEKPELKQPEPKPQEQKALPLIPFTTLETIKFIINKNFQDLNLPEKFQKEIQEAYAKRQGKL